MEAPLFSERIARRRREWWMRPSLRGPRSPLDGVHRLRERRAIRHRDDPDEDWRCCARWPRTLMDKHNSREYAAHMGCQVPELFWEGTDLSEAPVDALPSDFVVRPTRGTGAAGTLIVSEGRELWSDKLFDPRELPAHGGGLVPATRPGWLIEERIRPPLHTGRGSGTGDEERVQPLELHVHSFAGRESVIEVVDRIPGQGGQSPACLYSEDWEPSAEPVRQGRPLADSVPPPAALAEILERASAVGASLGTYMRIDFYAADRGAVFGEFSCTPRIAEAGSLATDQRLGELWALHCPDTI